MKKRNLPVTFLLLLVTLGFYSFYWWYATKNELQAHGASIPPYWFIFLPFFNFYFYFRYAQAFARLVCLQEDPIMQWGYFFLVIFLPFISLFVLQYEINKR